MSPAAARDFPSLAAKEAWERSCAGKDHFPSRSSAEAFAELMHHGRLQLRKSVPRSEWADLVAYKCRFASKDEPHWHPGHAS